MNDYIFLNKITQTTAIKTLSLKNLKNSADFFLQFAYKRKFTKLIKENFQQLSKYNRNIKEFARNFICKHAKKT